MSTMRHLAPEESYQVRDQLLQIWGYDGLDWEPHEDKSQQETIFIMEDRLAPEEEDAILQTITAHAKDRLFVVSAEEAMETDRENFDFFLYRQICCDSTYDWVVYHSFNGAWIFGGSWLVAYIRELFSGKEHLLNNWDDAF